MKKYILLCIVLIFCAEINAGVNLKKSKTKLKKQTQNLSDRFSKIPGSQKNESLIVFKAKNLKAPVGQVVGTTTYDLQSNSGMGRRVTTNPQGTFTYVGWTMGKDYTTGAPNRGTGFNFYNRNTGKWALQPNTRIEPLERTGWPSLGFSQGRQFVVTHAGTGRGMSFTYRTGNQSDWQQIAVGEQVNDGEGVWARAAAEAPNIYAIIGRQSFGDGAASPFAGIPGGLNFIRSLDNGNTWESTGGLEENYAQSYPGYMSADDYQIDVSDSLITVIFGSYVTDMALYKSKDQGETWSKTKLYTTSNPLGKDLNENAEDPDFTIEAHLGSDGGNSVIIDSEGLVHVVYSAHVSINLADNDVSEGRFYAPLDWVSALFYWNENMSAPQIIGKTVMNDNNGDGNLGFYLNRVFPNASTQYSNAVAHPQLGIDSDDNLYVSYSAMVDGDFVPTTVEAESSDDGGMNLLTKNQEFPKDSVLYYDVFMIKSMDKGASWQGPLNVTKASDSEEVYPSIARNIKDTIFLVYQHDILPGNIFQPNTPTQNFATLNEVAVAKILPEEINDAAAPPDSEPYISALFNSFIVPQNCSVDKDVALRANTWGMDYPEGLLTEIKLEGDVDYSTPGTYTEAIYVEDSAGNKSDTLHIEVQVIPDEQAPVIEIEGACTEFAVLAGSEWINPTVSITDMVEFEGEVDDSGCDVSENLQIEDNVDTEEVGSYTVVYTVNDFAGNESSLTLNVEVIAEDTEGPEITVTGLPELIGLFDPFNPDNVKVIARDNVDCENVLVDIVGLEEINTEELGDYQVTITATDQSDNTTVEEFTVTVGDNTAPLMQLLGGYTIEIGDFGQCGDDGIFDANDDPGVYASDDTQGDLSSQVEAVYNNGETIDCACGEDGTEFYTVTYSVSDAAGNSAMIDRQIKVVCVGIEDNPIYEFVDIFPNPTKGAVYVKTADLKVSEIKMYNIIGKTLIILKENDLKAINQLDLSAEAEGMYMVNVVTDKGTITRKIHVFRN